MKTLLVVLALAVSCGPTMHAQGVTPVTIVPLSGNGPLAWPSHRDLADYVSTFMVAGNIAGDSWASWKSADPQRAFTCQAVRTGITIGAAELVKHVVHRTRPDGSDRMSFYSEHTALAVVSSGWRFQIGVPIAIGAGYLRIAADRHFPSDVAVGAVAGFLARKVCR